MFVGQRNPAESGFGVKSSRGDSEKQAGWGAKCPVRKGAQNMDLTKLHTHTLRQAGIEENEWYTESQTQMLTEARLVIQMRKPPGGKGQGKREGPCPFCLQRGGGAYYDNRPFLPVGILA